MKFLVALAALVAVASAGLIAPLSTISRAPAFDSAVIQSDRIGGNFAYSTAENHAYAVNTPIVQNVQTPVAVSYSAPAIAAYAAPAYGYAAYAPAAAYTHGYAAGPAVLAL
ncbi:cuticle protein 16.5-like [Cloeon dipterum]|uniref:cuticle protein 16.5-like n=1 Tax=Cloeon dipterum TaxID=197152 RepID=UPI0032205AD9